MDLYLCCSDLLLFKKCYLLKIMILLSIHFCHGLIVCINIPPSGNSSSAILDGTATMTLLRFGEEYVMSMPYAHCKGLL